MGSKYALQNVDKCLKNQIECSINLDLSTWRWSVSAVYCILIIHYILQFKEEDLHEQNDSPTTTVICELKNQSEDDKNTTGEIDEDDEDEEDEEELEQTSSFWNTTASGGNTDVHLIQIEEILKASSGVQILDYYSRNGALNSKYRQMLGACIVKHLIEKKVFPRPKHFDLISDDIVNYFKNEEKVSNIQSHCAKQIDNEISKRALVG